MLDGESLVPWDTVDEPHELHWQGDWQSSAQSASAAPLEDREETGPRSHLDSLEERYAAEPSAKSREEGLAETTIFAEKSSAAQLAVAPSIRINHRVAGEPLAYQAFPCGSGLVLYRGVTARFDPADVALRLLHATSGWVIDGSEVERWQDLLQASEGQRRMMDRGGGNLPDGEAGGLQSNAPKPSLDWLHPVRDDDASWIQPFLERWGSNRAWLVFARAEPEDVARAWLQLHDSGPGQGESLPVLRPATIADFMANRTGMWVQRFFAPLDAVLLEIHGGERWALFGRRDLEACLQDLNFITKPTW